MATKVRTKAATEVAIKVTTKVATKMATKLATKVATKVARKVAKQKTFMDFIINIELLMSPSNTLAYFMSLFGAVDFEGKRGKVNFLDFKASHTIVTLTKLVIHGILDNNVKT